MLEMATQVNQSTDARRSQETESSHDVKMTDSHGKIPELSNTSTRVVISRPALGDEDDELVLPPKLRIKQRMSASHEASVLKQEPEFTPDFEEEWMNSGRRKRVATKAIDDDWLIFSGASSNNSTRRKPSRQTFDEEDEVVPSRYSDRHRNFVRTYRSGSESEVESEESYSDVEEGQAKKSTVIRLNYNSRVQSTKIRTKKGQLVSDEGESESGKSDSDSGSDFEVEENPKKKKPKNSEGNDDNKNSNPFGRLVPYVDSQSERAIDWVMDYREAAELSEVDQGKTLRDSSYMNSQSLKSEEDWKGNKVEFLIKWRNFSHLNNSWLSYSALKHQMSFTNTKMRKLDLFIAARQADLDEQRENGDDREFLEEKAVEFELNRKLWQDFTVIESILDHVNVDFEDESDSDSDDSSFYLVKWKSLPFSQVTWERESILRDLEGFKGATKVFKERRWSPLAGGKARMPSVRNIPQMIIHPKKRPTFKPFTEQPWYIGDDLNKAGGSGTSISNDNTVLSADSLVDNEGKNVKLLRDYQLHGLNWLAFCWHTNVNSILADEMGLGKTIQSISFLNYLYSTQKLDGPFLLVVPLSTIHNWYQEFAKWAPAMSVLLYMGDAASRDILMEYAFYPRKKDLSLDKSHFRWNVLLTTYEFVIRDKSLLGNNIGWQALVVDEAHRLKNEASLLHTTLRENFIFYHRLLITGTPLQNSLRELYALLSFLEPEKFPEDWYTFSTTYLIDDVENENIQAADSEITAGNSSNHLQSGTKGIQYLHSILKPHLLRRLKKDVEKSLPLKKERILRVELSPLQKLLYKWILTRNYKELNRTYNSGGAATGSTSLLNIIGELKKASMHPYLFPNGQTDLARSMDPEGLIYHSGKMVLLDALLKRLLADNHRVLIFSQSVKMLDLLGEFLAFRGWSHLRLDGSVPSDIRKRSIERFNAPNSTYNIFLLSTRAGGLGINLETADTVVLFDSDWNPQNDLQAMARAHRIGQKKFVNVYRLVSKDSVEEEILERAKKKMVLDHVIIQRIGNQKTTGGTSTIGLDLQKILMFSAKALFGKDDSAETSGNGDFEEKLLWHQLMTSTSGGPRKWNLEREDEKADAESLPDTEALPDSLKAILRKPGALQFDLEAVLKRSEEEPEEPEDQDLSAHVEDKNFLDSFQVADLSSALSWNAIIPEGERTTMETADLIIKEKKESEEMQKSIAKRNKLKEQAIKRMSQSHNQHEPISREERARIKEEEKEAKMTEKLERKLGKQLEKQHSSKTKAPHAGTVSRMEEICFALLDKNNISFKEPELLKNVVKRMWLYGTPLNPAFNLNDELPPFQELKLLCHCIKEAVKEFFDEFKLQKEREQKGRESNEQEKTEHTNVICRTFFCGSPIYPHNFLRRIMRLEILYDYYYKSMMTKSQFEKSAPLPIDQVLYLSPLYKLPIHWSFPWQVEEDVFLLESTVQNGHWNFEPLKEHPRLAPKLVGVFHKKEKEVNEEQNLKETPKQATIFPNEDQLKKRVDFLLDILFFSFHPEEIGADTATASKKKQLPKHEGEPKKIRKATSGTSAHGESQLQLSESLNKSSKKKSTGNSHFSAKEISGCPPLTKLFKTMFKPFKKTLLMLDALEEPHSLDSAQEIALVKTVLLQVGSYIENLTDDSVFGNSVEEDTWFPLLDECPPTIKTKWSLMKSKHMKLSCWHFVSLCWPTEIDPSDLALLYQRLVNSS